MMIGWLGDRGDGWINHVWASLAVIGDEWDMEESIERAWLGRVLEAPTRRRRRWSDDVLAHYPLTQPSDICSRCLRRTYGYFNWDLDHIVELQFGGLDHPGNLVRLCRPCHKSKPMPPESLWDDTEAMRRFVLAWVRKGPPNGKRERWDWTE